MFHHLMPQNMRSIVRNLIRTCLATACVYQLLPILNWHLPILNWHLPNPFRKEKQEDENLLKVERYFEQKNMQQLLTQVDKLFNEGKYIDVYEKLNKLKFQNNGQISWRISRVLYHMSLDSSITDSARRAMVFEAHDLIMNNVTNGVEDGNMYTWLAIITHSKNGFSGTSSRAQSMAAVKSYLEGALDLNPEDRVVLYLLGKLCYDMSSLTWFQRKLATVLYGNLPVCTYDEAYDYLLRANENDKDKYYIPNLYMLGKTCLRLKQYYRARFYLSSAASLPPRTNYERAFALKAQRSVQKLDEYDVTRNNALFEMGMDNH